MPDNQQQVRMAKQQQVIVLTRGSYDTWLPWGFEFENTLAMCSCTKASTAAESE